MRHLTTGITLGCLALAGAPSAVFGIDFPPSQSPPGGLQPSQVPQFIVLGFDDQISASAFHWVYKMFSSKTNPAGNGQKGTYDGSRATASFYTTTTYGTQYHLEAYNEGHEIGNHTQSHPDGSAYSQASWEGQLNTANTKLTAAGIPKNTIAGFRAPFLLYNNNAFSAMQKVGITYDCSIEEGYQADQDGTDYFWPYTLDRGSPGNKYLFEKLKENEIIGSHPGLWEMPAYYVIVPPEMRAQVKKYNDYFDEKNGKLTGLDYNLIDMGKMSPDQFTATLKYNLDIHYGGNRSPFIFGGHSDKYGNASLQKALVSFIDYALTKPDVRIVSAAKVLQWMQAPVPLRAPTGTRSAYPATTPPPQVKAVTSRQLSLVIPESGVYAISLFHIDGRKIIARSERFSRAGENVVQWNNARVLPGMVCLVRITGGNHSIQEKRVVF